MMNERDYWGRGGRSTGSAPWSSWSAVKTLLIINVVVYFLCSMDKSRNLVNFLALSPYGIERLQVWKLFTYMFTHVQFYHILGNMWSLWIFGGIVERALGKSRTLQLYIFSGLIGAVIWLLCNWEGSVPCIGASGSVFGIMTAAAMAFPEVRMQLLFPPVAIKLRTLAIFFAIYEILSEMSMSGYDNVAHLAHIGGMLGGLIYMRRLAPSLHFFVWKHDFKKWFRKTFGGGSGTSTRGPNRASSSNGQGAGSGRLGPLDSAEVDRVLDKLAATGRSSLTEEEKALLEEASRRLKDN